MNAIVAALSGPTEDTLRRNGEDPHKVQLASIHLYDTASLWHRQFVKLMGENASWNSFKEAILLRFRSSYDDPMAEIKNLRHVGTIEEYQNNFDKLNSRVDLPEDQQISFYITGLQSEIELAVRMFRPKTLAEEEGIGEIIEFTPQISLHSLNGVESFQTMRVTRHVGKQSLHILIDTGSTHIFLDIDKAKKWGCTFSSTCPLKVDIPVGAQLTSRNLCKKFSWKMHGEEFVVDAMVLPLGGCDMVLGF
ncbi:putative mitochondrial protein [Tanacetum coccineum]